MSKALSNALSVLKLFNAERPTWSVTRIAAVTGLSKSHVSKILHEFANKGYLIKDSESRHYHVGAGAFELGAGFLNVAPLASKGQVVASKLAQHTGFYITVNLSLGDSLLFVSASRGPHTTGGSLPVGSRIPLYATAAGKLFAAFMPEERLSSYLANTRFVPLTRSSIRDPEILREQINEARVNRYATTNSESTFGMAAIAAPIVDCNNNMLGALGLLCPVETLNSRYRSELIEVVVKAAKQVEMEL